MAFEVKERIHSETPEGDRRGSCPSPAATLTSAVTPLESTDVPEGVKGTIRDRVEVVSVAGEADKEIVDGLRKILARCQQATNVLGGAARVFREPSDFNHPKLASYREAMVGSMHDQFDRHCDAESIGPVNMSCTDDDPEAHRHWMRFFADCLKAGGSLIDNTCTWIAGREGGQVGLDMSEVS